MEDKPPTVIPHRTGTECVLAISALSTDYGWDDNSYEDEEKSLSSLGSGLTSRGSAGRKSWSQRGFGRFGVSESVFSVFNSGMPSSKSSKGSSSFRLNTDRSHIGTIPEEGDNRSKARSSYSSGGTLRQSNRVADSETYHVPTFRPKGSLLSQTRNSSSSTNHHGDSSSCGSSSLDDASREFGISGDGTFSEWTGSDASSIQMRQSNFSHTSGLLGSERSGTASMMRQSHSTDSSGLLGSHRSGDISMNTRSGRNTSRYSDISSLPSGSSDSGGMDSNLTAASMMHQSCSTDTSGLLGSDRSGDVSMKTGSGRLHLLDSDTISESSGSSRSITNSAVKEPDNGSKPQHVIGILRNSHGSTQNQLLHHKRRLLAMEEVEVDVTEHHEEPPIPHDSPLLHDRFGNRYHSRRMLQIMSRAGMLPNRNIPLKRDDDHIEIIDPVVIDKPVQQPHSYATILAAIVVGCVVVFAAIDSLSGQGRDVNELHSRNLAQTYQFGGGGGGLLGGIDHEERRRQHAKDAAVATMANPAFQVSNSRPVGISIRSDGHKGIAGQQQPLPTLTSSPLTSYAPPLDEAGAVTNVVLDPTFDHQIIDLSTMPYNSRLEIPIVLDLPLTGGSALKSTLGNCLKMVQCTNHGHEILEREHRVQSNPDERGVETNRLRSVRQGPDGTDFDPPLKTEVVFTPTTTSVATATYVNVDCSTSSGVDRGIRKDLVTSNMVDIIYSPQIHYVARLFDPSGQMHGRAVILMRNPIERAVAKYIRLGTKDDNVKKMSLAEFAQSPHLENNIVTRSLVGKSAHEHLSGYDLVMAKEILKRKFVVGLFDQMEESFERFESFFGWNVSDGARTCQQHEIGRVMEKLHNKNLELPQNAAVLLSLAEKNRMDVMLYDYAKFLYDYQGHVLFGVDKE